jgi:hypothetical protein
VRVLLQDKEVCGSGGRERVYRGAACALVYCSTLVVETNAETVVLFTDESFIHEYHTGEDTTLLRRGAGETRQEVLLPLVQPRCQVSALRCAVTCVAC